jgi:hypothetical protein
MKNYVMVVAIVSQTVRRKLWPSRMANVSGLDLMTAWYASIVRQSAQREQLRYRTVVCPV